MENQEQLAIRQVASLLYSLLTRTPSTLSTNYHLDAISPNVPMEFRVICKRGLDLKEKDGFPTVPMATIAELEALLGDYESRSLTAPILRYRPRIRNARL